MTDLTKDITDLVKRIDSMPADTRDGILNSLLAAKAERQATATRVPLRSPVQAMAADARNKPLLKQVIAQLARDSRAPQSG
jgi:hypothetical protein